MSDLEQTHAKKLFYKENIDHNFDVTFIIGKFTLDENKNYLKFSKYYANVSNLYGKMTPSKGITTLLYGMYIVICLYEYLMLKARFEFISAAIFMMATLL